MGITIPLVLLKESDGLGRALRAVDEHKSDGLLVLFFVGRSPEYTPSIIRSP